jgi:LPXTG-motif cell wall-anchored protein
MSKAKTSPSKTPSKTPWSKAVWPTAVAGTAAVAAAFVLPGGAAFAASRSADVANTSVGSGNQALLSLNLPADICGLAIAVLGSAESSCEGGAMVQGVNGGGTNGKNTDDTSVASGNKVSVPVNAPVTLCGVAIAILGPAQSGCQGGSNVIVKQAGGPGGPGWPGNPGGPSGPTEPGGGHHGSSRHDRHDRHDRDHSHHAHHKRHEKHHTSTSTNGGTTVIRVTADPPEKSRPPALTAVLTSTLLPTTGANLAGMVAVGLACLGLGTGVVVAGRRRRSVPDET